MDCLAKYGYNGNARKTLENMKLMFLQSFGHILKNINQTNTDCINLHHFQWQRKTIPMQESYRNNIFPAMYLHQDIFISRTQQYQLWSAIYFHRWRPIYFHHTSARLYFLRPCKGAVILKLCENCFNSETSMIFNLIVCKGLMLGPG